MKKVDYVEIKVPKSVNLYRKDLVEIEDILIKELGGKDLKIRFDNFESNSVRDIPADQILSNAIHFKIFEPHLDITIGYYVTTIYSSTNSLDVLGAIEKIKQILDRSEISGRKLRLIIDLISRLLIGASIPLLIKSILFDTGIKLNISALLVLSIICAYLMNVSPKTIIQYNEDQKSFWHRKKDDLIIQLMVIVVSSVFTIGFQIFFSSNN